MKVKVILIFFSNDDYENSLEEFNTLRSSKSLEKLNPLNSLSTVPSKLPLRTQ